MKVSLKKINLFCFSIILSFLLFSTSLFSQGMREKVLSMNEIVSDPDRQVGSFDPDSMPSLPIGIRKDIAGTEYIIAIDSAYFLPDGAYFSAYMAVTFPGAEERLAFAAKDIKFNPKGIIGGEQSRLQLVSEHLIEIGPNTKLLLPGDGSNYVRWTCNGFESVNLHGFFLFEDGMLSPPENSTDSMVTAEFAVNVTDVHNMMAMVNFSPFTVKGLDDFNFTVSEAYVDMSDFSNPAGVTLPSCYQQTYSSDISLWRGFYLKLFSVQLPSELEKNDQAVTIYGSDIFIDDAGVTGFFGAQNVFSTSQGKLSGDWGFSVDLIEVGLTTNKLTQGKLKGQVVLPPLDNSTLTYDALITQNALTQQIDYSFALKPTGTVSMSCFNSTLTLYNTSSMSVSRLNRVFNPELVLNGTWTLNNTNWQVSGLAFENFTIIAQAPYVTNGYFSLVSSGSQPVAGNFPVSISNIGVGIIAGAPVFGANISLNFGEPSEPSTFSASTSVKVYSKVELNSETNKKQWKYDKFALNTINLAVNTNAFKLEGFIDFKDDDPVYGKGFYGGMILEIPSVLSSPMTMACAFGRVNGFRYWMVDATIPIIIPVGVVTITSITGGIAYHMVNTKSQQQLISNVSPTQNSGSSLATNYVPSAAQGLYFKAGVGFKCTAKEETLNGDVLFTISFNSNGGLSNINLSGDVYTLVKVSERQSSSNYAKGTANINYDNQEKKLTADLSLYANFSGALTANIWSQMYFKPGLWYVHLGKPSNQCTVNLLNLASANAYFMIGQNLEPMPPPPPQVASVISGMNNQRDEGSIVTGNGIATGMSFNVSFNKTLPFGEKISLYGSGAAGAGFDMTLYKYATTSHCAGSSGPFGLNYWFLTGQLYAYAGINAGLRKIDQGEVKWDVSFFEANIAVLLQGKLPKPSYVYGGVYVQGKAMGFEVARTFDFGTNCTIVN